MREVRSFTGSYEGSTKTVTFSFEIMNSVVIEATPNMGWMIGRQIEFVKPKLRQLKAKVIEV